MPAGIMIDVCAVAAGGLLGGVLGRKMPRSMVESLNLAFGFCAIVIGINSVIKLHSMTIVIVSIILGMVIGELLGIEKGIGKLIHKVIMHLFHNRTDIDLEFCCTAMAIFAFSGTGIFGAMSEGMDGDSSILLAKAVLDFFTAMVFAARLGSITALYCVPQLAVLLLCYMIAKVISSILTPAAVSDFKAAGGLMTMTIGYNLVAKENSWKKIRVLNMLPAFAIVLLISALGISL